MGQEISHSQFSAEEHAAFHARLREETKTLKHWFDQRAFDGAAQPTSGLEVEAWLLDQHHLPAPRNAEFLATVNHPYVVPELSQFNFELNSDPLALTGDFLSRTLTGLSDTWQRCTVAAEKLQLQPLAIGILPTVRDEMLQPEHMSASHRYQALNQELLRLRQMTPLHIDISGDDTLNYRCSHLMLEAACTSLQVHLKLPQDLAPRFYNAAVMATAPVVAATANSPFLYAKSLWAETRVPAFEQVTAAHGFKDAEGREVGRVTLGTGYLRHSLLELFLENLSYPTLLPELGSAAAPLSTLRLHNGTIWRWCRPIVGFEADGTPHLRIEHRVMPAGPTLGDMVANMALCLGLSLALGHAEIAPELWTPFEDARANFYACAREGLDAQVRWSGTRGSVQTLLLDRLMPAAKAALADAGLDRRDLDFYFDEVLRPRVLTGINGSTWQRRYIQTHGRDFQALTERYTTLQKLGTPGHTWPL